VEESGGDEKPADGGNYNQGRREKKCQSRDKNNKRGGEGEREEGGKGVLEKKTEWFGGKKLEKKAKPGKSRPRKKKEEKLKKIAKNTPLPPFEKKGFAGEDHRGGCN